MKFAKVKKEQEREGGKMGEFLKKLLRCVRIFWGVFFALGALGGVIACFTDFKPEYVIMVILFAVIAFLLLRKKKAKREATTEPARSVIRRTEVSPYAPDAPEETLRDMRIYYTKEQIENDVRILSESFKLAQQTANIDTFTSRLALAQRTALTLLQAEKAGCKGILPGTGKTCDQVLSSVQSLKIAFLENSYIRETTEAMLLKTPSGQRKRMEAYLSKLAAHKNDFLDVIDTYDKVVRDTKDLMP
mgnify:CR=1 FL=1